MGQGRNPLPHVNVLEIDGGCMDEILVLINKFVSLDMDIFKLPWLSKGNIIATNGRILLSLPVNIIGGISYPQWMYDMSEPNVTAIFLSSTYAPVKIKEVMDIVNNTVLLYADVTNTQHDEACEDCGGRGKNECPTCGDGEVECETCGGKGRVITSIDTSKRETKRETKNECLTIVKVRGINVDCHILKKVLEVMEYFTGEIAWEVSIINKYSPILFKNSSGVKMAIMPVYVNY